jgi:hypothetical protein
MTAGRPKKGREGTGTDGKLYGFFAHVASLAENRAFFSARGRRGRLNRKTSGLAAFRPPPPLAPDEPWGSIIPAYFPCPRVRQLNGVAPNEAGHAHSLAKSPNRNNLLYART